MGVEDNAELLFQSTLLMRGATQSHRGKGHIPTISIHAPHARSDACIGWNLPAVSHFNPRSSCEERLYSLVLSSKLPTAFQSTLLMRGATLAPLGEPSCVSAFQSTLLMRGATTPACCTERHRRFQSTLLMRGATDASLSLTGPCRISIHAPHARSDGGCWHV